MIRKAAALFAAAVLSAGVACAAPRVTSIESLSELKTPLPYPYDDDQGAADADAHVDAALAEGRRTHRLLFIDLGGNWCADCRILSGLMELPEYRRFLDAHYVVVMVDVGRFNKNLQVPARWGIAERLYAAPAILIVDPGSGRLVNDGHVYGLGEARRMDPQSVMDWIAQWAW